MATLKDYSKEYEPVTIKNIADLDIVEIEKVIIDEKTGIDKDNKEYKYKSFILNNEEYRVPESVLMGIKTNLNIKPTLKKIKVIRQGKDLNTRYTVVPIE